MRFVVNFYTPSFWGSFQREPKVLVCAEGCSTTEPLALLIYFN